MAEQLTPFLPLGIGGVLSGVMLFLLRDANKEHKDYVKDTNTKLVTLVENSTTAMIDMKRVVEGLAASMRIEERLAALEKK